MARMKKWLGAVVLVGLLSLTTMAFAGFFGFSGKDAKGVLCCIKKICLMSKSTADCSAAGGSVVGTCEECAK